MGYMQDKRRGGDYHGKHSLCRYSNTDDFLYGHEREDNAHKVPFPRQERGTINIEKIISTDQQHSFLGANFVCTASIYGAQKTFRLRYNYHSHEWRMSEIGG